MSTWVLTFSDRTVKAIGHNAVIAAHINIPRYLPPAAYYGLDLSNLPFKRGFLWVWAYLNGTEYYDATLADLSYIKDVLERLTMSNIHDVLRSSEIGIVEYPYMKLVKQLLSSPRPGERRILLVRDIWEKGYLGYLFPYTVKKPYYETTENTLQELSRMDVNYLSLFPVERRGLTLPPSLLGKYEIETREDVEDGADDMSTGVPVGDKIYHILSKIRRFASGYPDLTRAFIVQVPESARTPEFIEFLRPLVKFIVVTSPPLDSHKQTQMRVYSDDVSGRTFVYDSSDNKTFEVPWIAFYKKIFSMNRGKKLSPYPPLSAFTPSSPPNFLVAGKPVHGCKSVYMVRSKFMLARGEEEEGERSLLEDDKWNPALEYAWSYINGIDNQLSLADKSIGDSIRIMHYLNYFDVPLMTDLFDSYLKELCEKILREKGPPEALPYFTHYISQIDSISRQSLGVFFSEKDLTGGLADQVVASFKPLVSRISRIFTFPYNSYTMVRISGFEDPSPGDTLAIYSLQDWFDNKPSLELPIFAPVRTAEHSTRENFDDDKYDRILPVGSRGVILHSRRENNEMYNAEYIILRKK